MLIYLDQFVRKFGKAGTLLKADFAQQGLHRIDEQAPERVAYMKVIDPLTSIGPSVRSQVVSDSAGLLIIRFPRIVFGGALVQIRIQSKVLFGKARRCRASGSEYEIEIEKQEIY
jgi:hypothetical protein